MSTRFPPNREADLVTFSTNFKTKIAADFASIGLSNTQATNYGTLHDAFIAARVVATAPETRSPVNVELKNEAKKTLIANIRLLVGIIQRHPGMTNATRIELGIPQRDYEPTPVPPPAYPPALTVKSVSGRTVYGKLRDSQDDTRRGKPPGVIGASLFSFVGEQAPEDFSLWKFEGNTGRTTFRAEFPVTVAPGAKVWLAAFWFNPSKESGPLCNAVGTNLQGGSLSQAA